MHLLLMLQKEIRFLYFILRLAIGAFDQNVPEEEINRKIIDHLSDLNMFIVILRRKFTVKENYF